MRRYQVNQNKAFYQHNIGLVVLNNENHISQDLTNAISDIAYSILLDDGDLNKKQEKQEN